MLSVHPLLAAPGQEGLQGGVRILSAITFVPITPDLQPHQGNPDIQGPVKLIGIGGKTKNKMSTTDLFYCILDLVCKHW